ncbi:MAG: hypothetical protein EBR51_03465, partial [Gammaproteobacteria bacterium]|nr:hypothetical protein [Gammaproteobacteria bacterium]
MKQRNVQWLVVAAAVSAASIASAQNETGGLEEVTVTAQRREQSLQDVPIAITAFTSEQLARRNIVDTYDLVRNIPNLTGNNNVGVGTSSSYYIRGIGNGESIATSRNRFTAPHFLEVRPAGPRHEADAVLTALEARWLPAPLAA